VKKRFLEEQIIGFLREAESMLEIEITCEVLRKKWWPHRHDGCWCGI
jgi:hypothetical protein